MIGIWQLGERLASAASCNAVVTVNPTKKWLWITIYDLGKIRQLDWGFVAPASARTWKSGNYLCGSFYHVRAEVKDSESPTQPTNNPRNLFDTSVRINPQLKDWPALLASIGGGTASGGARGAGGGPAGVVIGGAVGAAVGVISPAIVTPSLFTESSGSITCMRTKDGRNFYWDIDSSCLTPPEPAPTPPAPVAQTPVSQSSLPALANIGISGGVAPSARRLLSVPSEGNRADLYNTDDGTGHQRWRLQLSPDRVTYNIVVFGGVNGGRRYLSTTDDGTKVDLYTSNDGSGRQRWRIQRSADGRSYNLIVAGGVRGGRTYLSTVRDGTLVDLYTSDNGSGRQRWTFTPQ